MSFNPLPEDFLESITPLSDTETFIPWRSRTELALCAYHLYTYVSDDHETEDRRRKAALKPVFADLQNPTPNEASAMQEWYMKNAETVLLLLQRLSPTIECEVMQKARTTPEKLPSARDIWRYLEHKFDRVDFFATSRLRRELLNLRMKNSADAGRYILEHERLVTALCMMPGYVMTEIDVVSSLLDGLPDYEEWRMLKVTLSLFYEEQAKKATLHPVGERRERMLVYNLTPSGPVEEMYGRIRAMASVYLSSRAERRRERRRS
ncbi:hypothetical protein CONPUDRAFT_139145 [Coniophora puteana RWD-64-598 SS2]|uniref:Retrotransposon gag domain-containing protein n=1 Tax=Coniophora puteana (strain RWD-64-598) TaxID=741705 RepID=A0A5M3MDV3_CONPW|nr:uncharacterized protein CONPUDRAFT_139145 [Coniophora puteana RWD-64-598 SS2]EIW77060.1 hypothetical protein CONPUDRAFT_139145 [Coniophora puteana RWD-64-598 SS2]